MGREEMLARIRKAEAGGEEFQLPEEFPSGPAYQDPVAKFKEELEALGGVLLESDSPAELRAIFQRILEENLASSITWENKEVLDRTGCDYPEAFQFSSEDFFTSSLHENGTVESRLTLTNYQRSREEMANIEISVSEALAGIAETGSIIESTGVGGSRIMPIIAPVHVVLLPAEKLLPTQLDFFSSFTPGEGGSAQIIMSGASRTADIEKTLIVGVHGPKKLYVVLV